MPWGAAAAAGVGLVSGMMQADAAKNAANSQAEAQERAAREAAEASRFRPVGVTTRFGSSNFTYAPDNSTGQGSPFGVNDPNAGKLIGAGYNLAPDIAAQQDQLFRISSNALQQYENAFGQSQALGQAGQGLMGLGQGYLATSPQEQAQKFYTEQQNLLAPTRAAQLSQLQNKLFQQGRQGLAVGGEGGMLATNPEMAAYYNALAQQDRELAAQATQGGMQYAQFGAGLLGTGGGLMGSMYDLQSKAFSPYQTALGGAQTLEGLGQQAMDMGINVGAKGQANLASQQLLQQGLTQAAATRAGADAQSPWAGLLQGASAQLNQYVPEYKRGLAGIVGNIGTAYNYNTTPGSQQTSMLQEQNSWF